MDGDDDASEKRPKECGRSDRGAVEKSADNPRDGLDDLVLK